MTLRSITVLIVFGAGLAEQAGLGAAANQLCFSDAGTVAIYNPNDTPAFVRVSAISRGVKLNMPTDGSQLFLGPHLTFLIRPKRARAHDDRFCLRLHSSVPLRGRTLGGTSADEYDAIWSAFAVLEDSYRRSAGGQPVRLRISESWEANGRVPDRNTVEINLGLVRALGTGDELAYGVAHEFGHIDQKRSESFRYDNQEDVDADAWAVNLMASAGFDPAAAKTAFRKLKSGIETNVRLPPHLSALFEQRFSAIKEQIGSQRKAAPQLMPGPPWSTECVCGTGPASAGAGWRLRR